MALSFEVGGQEAQAVLRLLSGPLCGCEYRLTGATTLVVAGPVSSLLAGDGVPEFPENAIVIPIEGGSNFEIVIDENARDGFVLRNLMSDMADEICEYQKAYWVGPISFAVRPGGAAWIPDLTVLPPSSAPERSRVQRSRIIQALFVVAVMFVIVAAIGVLWNLLNENKHVTEVAAVVAGASEPLQLVKGRDGVVYVFAKSERDVAWSKQALTRAGLTASARVVTLRGEEERLHRLLLEVYPQLAFYRIKLLDPALPELLLSQERNRLDAKARQAVMNSLSAWMPYAEKIGMVTWSDAVVAAQAKAGLDGMGVIYDLSQHQDNVIYQIQGDLSDVELAKLKTFIDRFYRDFGKRYVYFSVVLKEDWLKGKSFKYGGTGYIKMTPQHWFFP